MFLELSIALKYVRAKRRNRFISFISLISILGITIGVVALITVTSVMNGFQKDLSDKILGAVSPVTVLRTNGGLTEWLQAKRVIDANKHIVLASPYLQTQAILSGDRLGGAVIRGIDQSRYLELKNQLISGKATDLETGKDGIIIGADLAKSINARIGSNVKILTKDSYFGNRDGEKEEIDKNFEVKGIFSAGLPEYDGGLAYIGINVAEKMFPISSTHGWDLKVDDIFNSRAISESLSKDLGSNFHVQDWRQTQANLFAALAIEKKVMFIILSLIILVAAFNLVSALVMLVVDKQSDIAILRTQGMSPLSVMNIFVFQGLIVGLIGIVSGGCIGTLLALNLTAVVKFIEKTFNVQVLSADVFYGTDVPSVVQIGDILWILGAALFFCFIATLYPAWRAASTNPAEALRYE